MTNAGIRACRRKRRPGEFLNDLRTRRAARKAVIKRIEQEMRAVGFDEVKIDRMATWSAAWARVGQIVVDGHVDTVGVGNPRPGPTIPSIPAW